MAIFKGKLRGTEDLHGLRIKKYVLQYKTRSGYELHSTYRSLSKIEIVAVKGANISSF